jgi:hypothetical protein
MGEGTDRLARHIRGGAMKRDVLIAAVPALVTLLLTGCGGGTSTNGLEDKSPA